MATNNITYSCKSAEDLSKHLQLYLDARENTSENQEYYNAIAMMNKLLTGNANEQFQRAAMYAYSKLSQELLSQRAVFEEEVAKQLKQ